MFDLNISLFNHSSRLTRLSTHKQIKLVKKRFDPSIYLYIDKILV